MNDVTDIKPWFREDLARTLMGIYFASSSGRREDLYREGFAAALSSVALAVGINPESFLSPKDIQLMRKAAS